VGSDAVSSAIRRTCKRSSAGAMDRASRSWVRRSSRCDTQCLLELAERPVEARRAVGGRDPEHPGGRAGGEVEDDPQSHPLPLPPGGRERGEPRLELRREPLDEALLQAFRRRGQLLAPLPALLRAEVVESGGPGDLAEPGPGGAAPGVEPVPEPQGPLERLAR